MAARINTSRIAQPIAASRWVSSETNQGGGLSGRRGRERLARLSVPSTARLDCTGCATLSYLGHARVEAHIDQVGEQVGAEHGQRDQQEERLNQRIVLGNHRVDQ